MQLVPVDACLEQPTAKAAGHVALAWEVRNERAHVALLGLHRFQERVQSDLDGRIPRPSTLGRASHARPAVPSFGHSDYAVLTVDVTALQNPKLTIPDVSVNGNSDDCAPTKGDILARNELQELARIRLARRGELTTGRACLLRLNESAVSRLLLNRARLVLSTELASYKCRRAVHP